MATRVRFTPDQVRPIRDGRNGGVPPQGRKAQEKDALSPADALRALDPNRRQSTAYRDITFSYPRVEGQWVWKHNRTGDIKTTGTSNPPDWVPVGMNADGSFKDASRNKLDGTNLTPSDRVRNSDKPLGGGGGGGGGALPPFASRLPSSAPPESKTPGAGTDKLNAMLSRTEEFTDETGQFTEDALRQLVDGLVITEVTDSILAMLRPTDTISFLVHSDEYGTIYYDAKLVTGSDLQTLEGTMSEGQTSNITLPHARLYALKGLPIRRSSWGDEWLLAVSKSMWLKVTATETRILQADDMTVADFNGNDWTLHSSSCVDDPSTCHCGYKSVAEPLPFKIRSETIVAGGSLFDVKNPPCKGIKLDLSAIVG